MLKLSKLLETKFKKRNFVILYFSKNKPNMVDKTRKIITVNYQTEIVWPSHVDIFNQIFETNLKFINDSLEKLINKF